jgi:hypothetical protein
VDAADFLYQNGFLRSCNEATTVDVVEQHSVAFVLPQLAFADGHIFARVHAVLPR